MPVSYVSLLMFQDFCMTALHRAHIYSPGTCCSELAGICALEFNGI